jgi:signal transduction histidine kinase
MMLIAEGSRFFRKMEFPASVESEFQASYYQRFRSRLQLLIVLLFLTSLMVAVGNATNNGSLLYFVGVVTSLILLILAHGRDFEQVWQPLVVLNILVNAIVPFITLARNSASFPNGDHLFDFCIPVYLVMVAAWWLRLLSRWMLLLQVGLVVVGVLAIISLPTILWGNVFGFVCGALIVMQLPLRVTKKYERFDRSEFYAKYELVRERDTERRKREHTEAMLHVLSQAIGGIVHDLGNPLTSVQTGAATLLHLVDDAELDRELVKEFGEIISDGAQMLNYLRLSLMEQTRVLEGKPIPLELKPSSLRQIVEAGARYQKPRFASGRNVSISGADVELCVDEMKLITVFMNLIGNALKYSDGEVRITWRTVPTTQTMQCEDTLLIAILDQGIKGQGISEAEAGQLFVPFGRLDAHTAVEGTGLGLLSVQRIVQAHGGAVFIEGFHDGTSSSAPFRSTHLSYSSMLAEDFRTAFVIACPLDTLTQRPPAHAPLAPEHCLPPGTAQTSAVATAAK